jgi:signal transduction histidine kinase/CheY-like chemotaxis protein/HPt (histidine-containing phosphotransfer) domain-containing protein
MAQQAEAEDSTAPLLSEEERRRVLSATRLKLTLTLFVVVILLALSAMIFAGVSSIFDWLAPSIRSDLTQKTKRGAIELAQTAQLGIIVRDVDSIKAPAADYLADPDVVALRVSSTEGERLFTHGVKDSRIDGLFARPPSKAHDLGEVYGAWAPSQIEGVEVGRIGILVSKARLEAGLELRRRILWSAALGCLLALALSLLFVSAYIGPILRVTGAAFVRLEHTTEAALAAARLKSQFLANMSHEIRTPMNGIIGVLDLLQRTELNPKQQRYAQIIETSARGLLTIINDVLDFSKLEAGKYVLSSGEVSVRKLAQEVAELLSPRANDKHLELITRVHPAVPHSVVGDFDRLKQVLNNLVGNAIKFTESGYVELNVTEHALPAGAPEDGSIMLRFAVRDTGVGIRPEDQARLFGVFSQVDGSLTRKYGGTGLGLAISKQLVQAMEGEIGVESEANKGSTFWFTIKTRAISTPSERVSSRDARILVVSPIEPQRTVVGELVESWGMEITSLDSPARASALIRNGEASFDVVLIDSACEVFPGESEELLDVCVGEALPVIHLLGSGEVARASPADAPRNYVLKPLRASELYNGLVNVLDGGRVQQLGNQSARPSRRELAAHRSRILVVDDNEINRLVAVDLLTELGYATETASNGAEAVKMAATGNFGVILMDCQMPELDGYEATRQIRALPEPQCRIPVIAVTAHALQGDRDLALKAGMDDYTTKPIRVRTVEQLLQRWGSERPAVSGSRAPANQNGEPTAVMQPAVRAPPELELDSVPELDTSLPRSGLVVELFLRTAPALLESLDAAQKAEDMSQVKQLAHKLKGSCLSLGANRVAAACHAIEQAAVSGQLHANARERLPVLFASATQALERTRGLRRESELPKRGSRHG